MSRRGETGPGWDISIVRTLCEAYSRLLRELDVMRRETDDLPELLSIAACADELQEKLDHWQRRMDRIETNARLQAHRQQRVAQVSA
jgi:hypothetical protein